MLVNLREMLGAARRGGYAVGLFNTINTDMLEAAVSAAEAQRAPIIIGTAEILLPYGELRLIAPALLAAARRARVPVAVHYDHGLTFERCMEALQLGFSSVMFDGSTLPYRENIEATREIVKIAHAFGATVEGEIGHVGEAAAQDSGEDRLTTPEEAERYWRDTGVDALAIAIGTAHGQYKTAPKISIQRLDQIAKTVDVPLVLHGGSGLSDEDFRNCVAHGIAKVNIFTDLCLAGLRAQADGVRAGRDYLSVRNDQTAAMREEIEKKMRLFGCVGRA